MKIPKIVELHGIPFGKGWGPWNTIVSEVAAACPGQKLCVNLVPVYRTFPNDDKNCAWEEMDPAEGSWVKQGSIVYVVGKAPCSGKSPEDESTSGGDETTSGGGESTSGGGESTSGSGSTNGGADGGTPPGTESSAPANP